MVAARTLLAVESGEVRHTQAEPAALYALVAEAMTTTNEVVSGVNRAGVALGSEIPRVTTFASGTCPAFLAGARTIAVVTIAARSRSIAEILFDRWPSELVTGAVIVT